jgi:isoleucyl-tRNA synthetase
LHQLVGGVTAALEDFDAQAATKRIEAFVEDLSNWYVRRSRRRFWKSEDDADKRQAYETLYAVLLDTCRVLAPYTPFVAEEVYRNLIAPVGAAAGAPDSVHLCTWPAYRAAEEDRELDERMDLVIRVVSMGRALRTAHALKVRQPLRAIHVATRDARARAALEEMADLVREELNVKEIRFDERESDLVEFRVKANFRSLGPRLGRDMQRAAQAIAALPLAAVLDIEAGKRHVLELDGLAPLALGPEDVVVERREKAGLFVECSGALTVALDHELTPELVEEGLAREFVNRVQNLRKETGLRVTDRIRIGYRTSAPEVARALRRHADAIRAETLAEALAELAAGAAPTVATDLNGLACGVSIEKVGA